MKRNISIFFYSVFGLVLALHGEKGFTAVDQMTKFDGSYKSDSETLKPKPWALEFELSNRGLFRSQIVDDDQVSVQFGANRTLQSGWSLGGSVRSALGSGILGFESQAGLARRFQWLGLRFVSGLEYVRWHHSPYKPMALVGFSVQRHGVRFLGKKDFLPNGGHHLEFNIRLLKNYKSSLALGFVDTVSPTKEILIQTIIPSVEEPESSIISSTQALQTIDLQYLSLQATYDISNKGIIFAHFYEQLQSVDLGSSWLIGMQWRWQLQ